MKISALYAPDGPFVGHEIYIVGTGPTMRIFPRDYLAGRTCVLLNDAQRWFPELGPIAFSNHRSFLKGCKLPYRCVKGRFKTDPHPERTDNHCPWDSPDHYVFSYREPPWDEVSHHDPATLFRERCFYWAPRRGSISTFAVQFALWCGAKSITLVGCDSCEFDDHEYCLKDARLAREEASKVKAIRQGRRRLKHDYNQYAAGLMTMIRVARERFGVPVVQVGPFPGYGREQEQFKEMISWT